MHLLKNSRLLLFLLIPLFRPGIVRFLSSFNILGIDISVNDIFIFWRFISFFIIFILFCYYGKITKLIMSVFVYLAVLLISTLYNSGSFFSFVTSFTWVMGVCLFFTIAIAENPIGLMRIMSRYLGFLFVVNLVLLFVFEGEILRTVDTFDTRRYFLGHRNEIAPISTLAILATCAYSYMTKKFSILSKIIIAVILVTHFVFAHFVIWSATGITIDFILVACILLISIKQVRSFFSFPVLFSINIFLFFFIVIFRLQEVFAFFIQDILGRSLTFTGRTYLWDVTFDVIAQSPIIGHGLTEFDVILFDGIFTGAHNLVLETLLRGGVLLLSMYLAIIILAGHALTKRKGQPISSIFSAGIFVVLIVALMSSLLNNIYLFAIFTLSFHVDKIILAQEEFRTDEVAQQSEKCENPKKVDHLI